MLPMQLEHVHFVKVKLRNIKSAGLLWVELTIMLFFSSVENVFAEVERNKQFQEIV